MSFTNPSRALLFTALAYTALLVCIPLLTTFNVGQADIPRSWSIQVVFLSAALFNRFNKLGRRQLLPRLISVEVSR